MTITIRMRSVEECERAIRSLDTRTLSRRAQKLAEVPVIETDVSYGSDAPNRMEHLLSESAQCFVNGQYNGSIATLGMAAEYGLRQRLHKGPNTTWETLIREGQRLGVLDDQIVGLLTRLRQYRNQVIHSRLDDLAEGVTLQMQRGYLTTSGFVEESAPEEFEPVETIHKEVAAGLVSEDRVRELLPAVRSFLVQLFENPESSG